MGNGGSTRARETAGISSATTVDISATNEGVLVFGVPTNFAPASPHKKPRMSISPANDLHQKYVVSSDALGRGHYGTARGHRHIIIHDDRSSLLTPPSGCSRSTNASAGKSHREIISMIRSMMIPRSILLTILRLPQIHQPTARLQKDHQVKSQS